MKKDKWNVVNKYGDVVCDCDSFHEAACCRTELVAVDKADGTYEKDYYRLERAGD